MNGAVMVLPREGLTDGKGKPLQKIIPIEYQTARHCKTNVVFDRAREDLF